MALDKGTIEMISAVAVVGGVSLLYWIYGDYKAMKHKHEHETKGGGKSRNRQNNKTKKHMK